MLHQIVTTAYFNTYLELVFFVGQILKKFCYEDQTLTNCNEVEHQFAGQCEFARLSKEPQYKMDQNEGHRFINRNL